MWPLPAQWADPLTDQGELTVSVGLINFYSLEAKKIPAGRTAQGDWLGRYRVSICVGIFCLIWSQEARQ